MKTYRAFVTLPNIGQTPVTIEARSTYEAKEKLEAQYGKMSPIHTRYSLCVYDGEDRSKGANWPSCLLRRRICRSRRQQEHSLLPSWPVFHQR
jgi:hypothetical protein